MIKTLAAHYALFSNYFVYFLPLGTVVHLFINCYIFYVVYSFKQELLDSGAGSGARWVRGIHAFENPMAGKPVGDKLDHVAGAQFIHKV